MVAVDGGRVYVLRDVDPNGKRPVTLYALDARGGTYVRWDGADTADLEVQSPDGLAAADGKLFLSYGKASEVKARDAASGREVNTFQVAGPGSLCRAGRNLLYVLSNGSAVLALDTARGTLRQVIGGLAGGAAVTVDQGGSIYVAVGEPERPGQGFLARWEAAPRDRPPRRPAETRPLGR